MTDRQCNLKTESTQRANSVKKIGSTHKLNIWYLQAEHPNNIFFAGNDNSNDLVSLNHSLGDNFTLATVNKIFIRKGVKVKQRFLENLKKQFNSSVLAVDTTISADAARTINKWIENKTGCKLKDVVKENMITESTRMLILNAIYLKTRWKTPFKKDWTKKEKFFLPGNKTVQVQTMLLIEEILLTELSKLKTKAIRLPFKGDRVVMDILLPDNRDGLAELEAKLSSVDVDLLVKEKAFYTKVKIKLPKFSFETQIKLNKPLEKLGVKTIFQPGGLNGMSTENLQADQIVQKAVIEVDEKGTEAVAVTVAIPQAVSGTTTRDFIADHPFLFFLRETSSGLILFQGKVNNPLLK